MATNSDTTFLTLPPGSLAALAGLSPHELDALLFEVVRHDTSDAAAIVGRQPIPVAVELLTHLDPSTARKILAGIPEIPRGHILKAAHPVYRQLWEKAWSFPENSVGQLMTSPIGVLPAHMPVRQAIEEVRRLSSREPITYLYATDHHGKLSGVVVLRDLFLSEPDKTLEDVMIRPPFFLKPEMTVLEAMKAVVSRHYPVYPVCDGDQQLLGLVRGHVLFEQQAFQISAQPGSLVGVRSQERLSTRWWASLKARHSWLQMNLILSLLAAVVVTMFKSTISKLVILAVFSPLVTAQARNASAQTMAIVLRGISTGEWLPGQLGRVLFKEISLAIVNGLAVGIVAALLMAWQCHQEGLPTQTALDLSLVMLVSMALSCAVSSAFGVVIPLGLRAAGADPALAAGIILSTIAGTLSSFFFFALAAWWTK